MLTVNRATAMLKAIAQQDADVRKRVDDGVRQLIFIADVYDGYAHASATFDVGCATGTPDPMDEADARLGDLIPHPNGDYRPGPVLRVQKLEHLLREKARINHEMLKIVANVLPYEAPPDSARCVGTGDASGATCTQWGWHKAGRCHDCHRKWDAAGQRGRYQRGRESPVEGSASVRGGV